MFRQWRRFQLIRWRGRFSGRHSLSSKCELSRVCSFQLIYCTMISSFVFNLAQRITLLLLIRYPFGVGQIMESASDEESCVRRLEQQDELVAVRFSIGQLRAMCHRQDMWANMTSESVVKAATSILSPKQSDWLNQVRSCQDLLCLCKHDSTNTDAQKEMPGICANETTESSENPVSDRINSEKSELKTRARRHLREKLHSVVRKEYRMLTDEERRRFHSAMNSAKVDMIDDISKYDLLTVAHTPEESPGAHFGPALLPFHRELLKQLEMILRGYDSSVGLPYWDTTLDQPLPNPADSVLWTEDFFGNGEGDVTSGPFKDWRSINDSQLEHLSPTRRIVRSVGTHPNGGLLRQDDVERLNGLKKFSALTYCIDPFLELLHGTVHMWVGGHMNEMRISPNDPTFFLFHSHVDYLWEQWRQLKQTAKQREEDYPTDQQSCDSHHFKDSPMKPFFIKNSEGLSNRYTNVFYSYDPSPTCSKEIPTCGSKWLFCDTNARKPRCLSKIVVAGNCTGFESQDACYLGRCVSGTCNALLNLPNTTSHITMAAEPITMTSITITSNNTNTISDLNEMEIEWNTTASNSTNMISELNDIEIKWKDEESNATKNEVESNSTISTSTTTPIIDTSTTTTTTSTSTATSTKTTESADTTFTATTVLRSETVTSLTTSLGTPEIALSEDFDPLRIPLRMSQRKLATRRPWAFFSADKTIEDDLMSVWFPITVIGLSNETDAASSSVSIRSKDRITNHIFNGAFGSPNNSPYYDGLAYVQVASPFSSPTGHSVSDIIVIDEKAQPCTAMCLVSRKVQPWKYVKCAAVVTLDVNPHDSDDIAFTSFKDQARLLNWQGSTKIPDQFMFICNTFVEKAENSSAQPAQIVEQSILDENATAIRTEEAIDMPVISEPQIGKSKENHCTNQHKCCSLWASVGECKQSSWMRFACRKSCSVCSSEQLQHRNDSDCIDYFEKCATWMKAGKCATRADWMEENCRKSCEKCNRSNEAMLAECGGRKSLECKNYDDRCSLWAKRGKCATNSWWMGQNCALACGKCSAGLV